jgi:hypothetical protein
MFESASRKTMATTMDVTTSEHEPSRRDVELSSQTTGKRIGVPAPAVYPQRMPATVRWRWAVLIITVLSTLCWSVIVLIMVALLARL